MTGPNSHAQVTDGTLARHQSVGKPTTLGSTAETLATGAEISAIFAPKKTIHGKMSVIAGGGKKTNMESRRGWQYSADW